MDWTNFVSPVPGGEVVRERRPCSGTMYIRTAHASGSVAGVTAENKTILLSGYGLAKLPSAVLAGAAPCCRNI